jgi:hypothetical protein
VQKHPRPAATRDDSARLKLHRRRLRLDGREYTVLTLRQRAEACFSSRRAMKWSADWQLITCPAGARLLARLLWGLSYQRRPDTILLLDLPHLTTTPFEADPPTPVVFVPSRRTTLPAGAAHALRRQLPLSTRPEGTVRLLTHGLDRAFAGDLPPPPPWDDPARTEGQNVWIAAHGGILTLAATDTALRGWAVELRGLRLNDPEHLPYLHLDFPQLTGELHLLGDFHDQVSVARQARADVLGGEATPPDLQHLRELIWDRSALLLRRRYPDRPHQKRELYHPLP